MQQAVLQKWDYHVEEFNNVADINTALSRLGNDGWELVSILERNSGESSGPVKTLRRKNDAYRAFFKRPAD